MLRHQESQLGVGIAWLIAPLWGMMLGFYLGTIWVQVPMITDLNAAEVVYSFRFGLIGLMLGVAVALVVTAVYPKAIDREVEEEAVHAHHH